MCAAGRAEFDADVRVADVVIEAFACHLPSTYIKSMAIKRDQGPAPQWFNLEYLSAEILGRGLPWLILTAPAHRAEEGVFLPWVFVQDRWPDT